MSETKWYEDFLKKFFHDPIDKPFDIPSHEQRANQYAQYFGISNIKKEDYDYSDMIASCMERSFLPSNQQKDFNEIRHPLSEEKLKYEINKDKREEESKNIIKKIEVTIEEISKSYKNLDDEKKSFLLWRNLIDEIIEKVNDPELKKYIPILPADTRVPDHSIWEHIKITTAINAKIINNQNLQNNSLFLFSIGPVQSFISQARKAQDFYIGSFIISYLTFIAIKQIVEKYGPTSIIYPDLHKQPLMDWYLKNKTQMQIKNDQSKNINLPTIPNRFVAIIPETDEEQIKSLTKEIKKEIEKELENSRSKIFRELDIEFKELENIIKTQFSDFPQIYWVSVPWKIEDNDININHLIDFLNDYLTKWNSLNQFIDQNGEHKSNIGFLYQLLYTTLEKSMGARKNIREFTHIKEEGRKCSICGERNVVFYRDEETPLFIKDNVNFFFRNKEKDSFIEIDKNKITYKIISKKEGLCSVCFWKRTFEIYLENEVDKNIFKNFSFPSTAEVACADFKEKAKDFEEFKNYEKEFFNLIKDNTSHNIKINSLPKLNLKETLEGSWFYEDNLNTKKIKDELGIDISQEKIEKIKEILLKNLQKKANKKPNSYYAVIYLDGDDMGKWLSGELLPSIENSYNSEIWEKLPENFKNELKKHLKKIHSDGKENKLLTPAIHSAISAALRNYSIEFVRKIVEKEHLGKLIYAGGDDVLAFVNLKDLFDVMEKLRWAFSGNIKFENNEIKVDLDNNTGFVLKDDVYYLTMGKNATCSMGVVIAHHKEPLKIVIDKVFEMGKIAKENGKNGFAISLMKHSGEERIGRAKWKIDNESTIEIFKKLKKDMNSENEIYISDGFIKKFKMEFSKFKDELSPEEEIVNTEIKRLVKRSYNNQNKSSKEDNKKEEFIKSFTENAIKLFWKTNLGIDNFVNLFEIISFTNRGE